MAVPGGVAGCGQAGVRPGLAMRRRRARFGCVGRWRRIGYGQRVARPKTCCCARIAGRCSGTACPVRALGSLARPDSEADLRSQDCVKFRMPR